MRVFVYQLEKCGFYRSDDDSTPEFGRLSEWWPEFVGWVKAKGDYQATCTFSNENRVPPRVYCASSASDEEGNFGVALWNEAPGDERGVAYLPPEGEVGDLQAEFQDVEVGSIPGWARYFWFMPDKSLVVALVPENLGAYRGAGMNSAAYYFYNYLRWHSSYVRVREIERERGKIDVRIRGYCRIDSEEVDGTLKPRFSTSQFKTSAPLREMKDRVQDIRKYIVNSSVEVPRPDHRGQLHQFLDSLMSFAKQDRTQDIQKTFRMELDWHPDREALQQAIDDWKRHEHGDNYWVGVKFKNDGRIHRFDEAVGRSSVELTGSWVNEPLWTQQDLVRAWQRARPEVDRIIGRLGDEQNP